MPVPLKLSVVGVLHLATPLVDAQLLIATTRDLSAPHAAMVLGCICLKHVQLPLAQAVAAVAQVLVVEVAVVPVGLAAVLVALPHVVVIEIVYLALL